MTSHTKLGVLSFITAQICVLFLKIPDCFAFNVMCFLKIYKNTQGFLDFLYFPHLYTFIKALQTEDISFVKKGIFAEYIHFMY